MAKEIDVKLGMSRDSRDMINFRITDDKSSKRIIDVEMELEAFALIVTGLAGVDAKATLHNTDTVGLQRETDSLVVDKMKYEKSWPFKKESVSKIVEEHFKNTGLESEGWEIFDDGTRVQQNQAGFHRYTIVRYV